jgi:hypothetical protein
MSLWARLRRAFRRSCFLDKVLPADRNDQAGADVKGRQNGQGDPSNIVVSGWQFYDIKGRLVEKCEPLIRPELRAATHLWREYPAA